MVNVYQAESDQTVFSGGEIFMRDNEDLHLEQYIRIAYLYATSDVTTF
jgi:hypothetical protein